MSVTIRNARPEDMDQIMAVEESWPEMARAPRDKFEARLQKYPQGFFVWEEDGRILATITSMPFTYDPENAKQFSNWDKVTGDGYLHDIGAQEDYNGIYIVSGIIEKDAVPASQYVFMKRGNRLVDPLLDMYQKIGFEAPDADHVVREYFPDDASLNYAAIVVNKL